MDLEVLNLKVEAQAVERATRDLNDLDVALDKVDRAALKLNDTNKVLRGEQLRVAGSAVKLSESLTKTQAGFLATMKQAGASANEIKFFSKQFENMNKIMGLNTFDKSANALARMRKQTEELTKSTKYIERYNDLTKQQISLLTQGIEATRQRAMAEQKNFGQREAAVKKFIKEFVKEAQAYNQVAAAIEEKNRVAREEIRIQQEAARAAQVSAKQRADAEKYVQETLQRTLFMNEQMDKGMSTSGANALYAYKQQLDLLGLSADQAAAKMQEFQSALTTKQGLQGRASPINKMREDIRNTTQEVNQLARAVSVQLGDVFVSLAGGMNPLLVAIQQGDQIRFALEQAKAAGQGLDNVMRGAFASMANSFVLVGTIVKDFLIDGIMSAGKLITNFNTSVIDAIGRMVGLGNAATDTIRALEEGAAAGNRFSAAMAGVVRVLRTLAGGLLLGIVAAIGTFAVASVKLSNDLDKLTIALNMSGASLGLTAQQAQQAAEKIGESYGTSIYDALDAVTLFATKNIQFTDEMIVSATELSRVTGKSLSDIIDSYSSLKGKPVEGLLDVAIATGQVNIETIKQIDKLVEQGETAKATQLAMQEKARAELAASKMILDEMTPLGRLYDRMKKDVSELGDAVYDLVTQSILVDAFAVAWKGVASVFHVIAWAVKGAGKLIGGIAAQLVALANLDFSGVMNIGNSMMSDAASGYRELEGTLKSLWTSTDELTRKELEAAAARKQADSAAASQLKKEFEERKKGSDSVAKEAEKTQKYFEKLMEGASDLALKTQQEVSKLNSGYEQMTNSQKMLFDAQNDPRWNSLSERQKSEFENALKLIAVNEELIRQYNAQVALQELLSKWADDYDSAAISIKEEVAALELRNNLLFKTEDEAKAIQRQYDLNVKLAAVENKYIERRNQMMMDYVKLVQEGNWSPAALEEYQRNMAAVAQQEAAERELAHKDANLKIVEDYEKRFREVQDTITDIVATALFEGGKVGSKKLKDVLKAEFRKFVIDVIINPIVGNTMGSVTGGAGMSGQSSGGVTGLISNASSAYNLATGSTVAGISGAVQGAGAFLGSSAVSSFGAGMTMTGTQVAALSEAGLIASKGAASLGSTLGAAMPWIAGAFAVASLLGAFDKKPSDKSSWATVDPTTGVVSGVGSMTGKKDPGQEQRDATVQLAQMVGQFAGMAGITSELVTMMGQRDGIRVKIVDGWTTPSAGVANGGDASMLVYGGIGDVETALVKMLDDLVDEGTLDQSIIDTWRNMKDEVDGTARASGELISVLNLLTEGYSEIEIERANLIQAEGESLDAAYARMSQYEKALAGTVLPGQALADSAKALVRLFENLNVSVPTTSEQLNSLISSLDLTTSSGQASYMALMNLVPAFLELSNAQEELYNQLLTDEQRAAKSYSDLSRAFSQLGVSVPKSNAELRSMIDAIDATTQAGAALKAQLLGLVPAFIETTQDVFEAQEKAKSNALDAVGAAYQVLEKAVDAEKKIIDARLKSLTDNLTRLKAVFDFLKNEIVGLLRSVSSTNAMQISQANALIKSVVVSGIIPDDKSLENAVSVAVDGVEKGIYASRVDQERATILLSNDLLKIQTGVAGQISETERLVRIEEKELARLESVLSVAQSQLNALNGINTSVLSVKSALANFQNALTSALSPPVTTVPSGGASGGGANGAAVSAAFQAVLGRAPEAAGLAYWSGQLASGAVSQSNLAAAIASAAHDRGETVIRAYADGGYYPGGIALVGEKGPELINFRNPGMVYTEAQTSNLLSGGGNLEEAIEALRGEVVMLRAETRAVALNTSRSAKLLDRAMPDGQSLLVTTTA